MPRTSVRIGGSGYTSINWNNNPIAWCTQVIDSGQEPGVPAASVTPLGHRFPVEIATPRYLEMGTLQLTITELWDQPFWWQLAGLADTNDLIDIWEKFTADTAADFTCTKFIKPPGSAIWWVKTYHGCVPTKIDDGEDFAIGKMVMGKNITIAYTNTTRSSVSASAADITT